MAHSDRKPLAAMGLLLVLSLLGSQFATTIHELKVRHAACAQHGELIETDAASGSASALTFPGRTQLSGQGLGHQNHTQHCLLVAARGQQKLFRLPAAHLARLLVVELVPASRRTEARRVSLAVYRTAPKHSPPRS